MAQRRPRRRFTREYKAQAVQRLIESGRPLADIAAERDVSPGQLSQWRNEQLAAGSSKVRRPPTHHGQKGRGEAEVPVQAQLSGRARLIHLHTPGSIAVLVMVVRDLTPREPMVVGRV